ncbi:hypothetical protein JOD43_000251 [Pullulanibacillus pueri]|uniref:Peptidyl-prolyl cis-trans isomerase n=1 Tax=Pullulanibacillus pueri TaxID=1437324 RepID=A0A8J3EKB6_9BACL|nr:peptidyl-prolyl cis-trans isomerase [Pullulanibacillus pueri]MBM7680092.1 hypothetical protein [Pullulanibacillus pueri]GGH74328.1 hypothetical protein GCM10007096_02440 [Pullulanibacillus pueri]
MPEIVTITGLVSFPLTLDPSSWIFDDRKIDIDDFFSNDFDLDEFLEAQKDERAGAAIPRLAKGQRKYKKQEWLTRSFAIPVKIFIENSEPKNEATQVTFSLQNGEKAIVSLEDAKSGVFAFSINGRIIEEDGPLHFYFQDPSMKDKAIKGITSIIVE